MERVYLDHSATTPLADEVAAVMDQCSRKYFGNPSSIHSYGQEARKLLEESRTEVASLINAPANDIVFTSCGSESNNMAIKGVAFSSPKKHIITTKVEHLSVLNTSQYLESIGFQVTYLDVDHQGVVDISNLQDALRDDTALVSIQHVNNETGAIQNIEEIAKVVADSEAAFHVDAVQSVGKLPVDAAAMKIDLLSASAHKINGPKGIGFLYINPRLSGIVPLIHGGPQEMKRRAGTINIPAVASFAAAAKLIQSKKQNNHMKIQELRDMLEKKVLDFFPNASIHSRSTSRIYNISSISFPGYESDSLLINLDLHGICASAGSACSSGSIQPSHVLSAMNVGKEQINSTIRFSFGLGNTEEQVQKTLFVLRNSLV